MNKCIRTFHDIALGLFINSIYSLTQGDLNIANFMFCECINNYDCILQMNTNEIILVVLATITLIGAIWSVLKTKHFH